MLGWTTEVHSRLKKVNAVIQGPIRRILRYLFVYYLPRLEVVTDLSTEAFMAALDRFVARRGIPAQIHSDCGTNYIGAARQLKILFKDAELQEALHARVPCQWRFNPPAALHFGGIWEAAIKITKLHLKKVVGNQVHTLEELTTLITRIEGVLNSRPLVAMSSDPNDLSVLTPGHFLIGQPIMAIPEHDISDIPQNRLKRWKLIKQALHHFGNGGVGSICTRCRVDKNGSIKIPVSVSEISSS